MEPNNFYIGKNSIHFGVARKSAAFFSPSMFTISGHTLTYAHSDNSGHHTKAIGMSRFQHALHKPYLGS